MKEIFIFRGDNNESYSDFDNRIKKLIEENVSNPDIEGAKVISTIEKSPLISIIPFKRIKISAVSIYSKANWNSSSLISAEGFSGAYEVQEAIPVAYVKNWSDLQLTPGICMLTLFRKKESIDHATFLDRWHNGHTPLSLRIHPLWHYSRNVVKGQLAEESEYWDGIVDEHFRTRSELMNPFKFFGNPLVIIPRMIKVYTDVNSFLDYKTIETYLARETWIKSF